MATKNTPDATPVATEGTAQALGNTSAPADPEPTTTVASDLPDVERPAMRELSTISYFGGSDVRVLSAADLRHFGVAELKSEDDLIWNRANNYSIPVSSVNAATLDAILKMPGFMAS